MLGRALLAALLALALTAPAAGAHATVVRTVPADTSILRAAPRVVQLRFSESVELGKGSVRLLDAAGRTVGTATAKHAGNDAATAVVALPSGLHDGTYVVAWRVTSADSHPVSGAFSFSLGAPSAVVATGEGETSRALEVADAIARGIAFVGLALALGGACMLLVLWPEGPASRRGRRFVWGGIGALAGGTAAALVLQGPYAAGGSLTDLSLLEFTLSTRFGHALVARLLLTAAFAALVAAALRRAATVPVPALVEPSRELVLAGAHGPPLGFAARELTAPASAPRDRRLVVAAAAVAVALLFTWTLTDHSRTGVQPWLGVPAATVHLLAMALWFGGLALLAVSVLGRAPASLEPALGRFSRLALGCFAALGVTGVYLAWRQSGSLAALPATDFGKLLLVKSGIVAVIVALAACSRRAVAQRSNPRRTVAAELVLGVVVLALTATLVNVAPARVAYAPPLDVSVPGVDGGRVQLHMEPAKQGANVADLYLVERDGGLVVPPEVSARLKPPEGEELGALPVELAPAEPGHYVASRLTVPFPGEWTLELAVRTSEIDEDVIDIPVRIR